MISSKLDASQIAKLSFDDQKNAVKTIGVGGALVPEKYTSISLTYDVSGNIATVTYFDGATQIALLTLSYDAFNRLTEVVRS